MDHLLALAFFSTSSFFLTANELLLNLAAFMISSAKHSAILLVFLKAAFLAPSAILNNPTLTLLIGETSTAYFLTTPPLPILVLSSLGPPLTTPLIKT